MTTREKAIAIAGACQQYNRCEDCPLSYRLRGGGNTMTCFGDYERHPEEIEQNFSFIFALSENVVFPVFDKKAVTAHSKQNVAFSSSHYPPCFIGDIADIKASMTADGFVDYCKENVLKYILRWIFFRNTDDMEKAETYAGWFKEAIKEKQKAADGEITGCGSSADV